MRVLTQGYIDSAIYFKIGDVKYNPGDTIPLTSELDVCIKQEYVASASTGDTIDFSFNREIINLSSNLSSKVFRVQEMRQSVYLENVEDTSGSAPEVSDYEGNISVTFEDRTVITLRFKVVLF